MYKKALFTLLLMNGLIGVGFYPAIAQENYTYTPQVPKESPNLQGYALYVPAGITLDAVLSCEINSQNAKAQEKILNLQVIN